jgi:zinc transport system ATP-binding protein
MSDNLIAEAKNIFLYKNDRIVLEDINFKITSGQIINIIGPNGAGKSSLMKIFSGITKPDKGELRIGRNTKIDYLPQKIYLNNDFPITVKEFLKLSDNCYKKTFDELADIFNINNLKKSLITELSGGELQKIYLIKTLASRANFLLLDEPIQYLDIDGQLQFYLIIEEICKKYHKSALIVSHDINVVMKSSQQIICLNRHICCQGGAEDIKNNKDFGKLFGGKLAKVIAPYQHNHDHTHCGRN